MKPASLLDVKFRFSRSGAGGNIKINSALSSSLLKTKLFSGNTCLASELSEPRKTGNIKTVLCRGKQQTAEVDFLQKKARAQQMLLPSVSGGLIHDEDTLLPPHYKHDVMRHVERCRTATG